MLSYRDRTFCTGNGCARFSSCPRALTPEVREGARAAGLPVSQFSEPRGLDCWEPERTETPDEDKP
jgi:hypothetical protein